MTDTIIEHINHPKRLSSSAPNLVKFNSTTTFSDVRTYIENDNDGFLKEYDYDVQIYNKDVGMYIIFNDKYIEQYRPFDLILPTTTTKEQLMSNLIKLKVIWNKKIMSEAISNPLGVFPLPQMTPNQTMSSILDVFNSEMPPVINSSLTTNFILSPLCDLLDDLEENDRDVMNTTDIGFNNITDNGSDTTSLPYISSGTVTLSDLQTIMEINDSDSSIPTLLLLIVIKPIHNQLDVNIDDISSTFKESASRFIQCRLKNLGNTCYLNVILQMFAHTPLLKDLIVQSNHRETCRRNPVCAFCLIVQTLKDMYKMSETNQNYGKMQQDCHELLMSLFNNIDEPSILSKAFGFYTQRIIRCNRCNNGSNPSEPQMIIEYGTDEQKTYHLYAFIIHIGNDLDNGHYICYVRNELTNEWESVYLLCYIRSDLSKFVIFDQSNLTNTSDIQTKDPLDELKKKVNFDFCEDIYPYQRRQGKCDVFGELGSKQLKQPSFLWIKGELSKVRKPSYPKLEISIPVDFQKYKWLLKITVVTEMSGKNGIYYLQHEKKFLGDDSRRFDGPLLNSIEFEIIFENSGKLSFVPLFHSKHQIEKVFGKVGTKISSPEDSLDDIYQLLLCVLNEGNLVEAKILALIPFYNSFMKKFVSMENSSVLVTAKNQGIDLKNFQLFCELYIEDHRLKYCISKCALQDNDGTKKQSKRKIEGSTKEIRKKRKSSNSEKSKQDENEEIEIEDGVYPVPSDYLNDILNGYSNWSLNFKSISRDDFDFICHQIQPEKVISLTISDDCDTPGQSELFFSRFQLEQFVHLRCLRLINIEFESLEHIFTNLHKLKQMKSFSFHINSITYKYYDKKINYWSKLKRLKPTILHSYAQVIPHLDRLETDNHTVISRLPSINLRSLKICLFSAKKLRSIMNKLPYLNSLDVSLQLTNGNDMNIDFESSKLTRLHLKIYGHQVQVSMNQMEQFLSKFSCLKYLKLILKGKDDLVDGYRWEMLTNSLVTFDFKFHVGYRVSHDSFQTLFWLEHKHWYVDSQKNCLFTIPYFYPSDITINTYSYQAVNKTAIKYVTSITIDDIPKGISSYFTHVKKLCLNRSFTHQDIFFLVSLKHVESLLLFSITDLLKFQPYEITLPKLSELIIENTIKFDDIMQMKTTTQIKQIQILNVSIDHVNSHFILKGLFYCYPHVKHLRVQLPPFISVKTFIDSLNIFTYTSNISFLSLDRYPDFDYVIENSKRRELSYRLKRSKFSCGLKRSFNNLIGKDSHFWIAPQTLTRLGLGWNEIDSHVEQLSNLLKKNTVSQFHS
ncbi:hypothetical protein I4U23_005924 [Adineta vaga]|nr:hypothetical protein I4U23_005924 [Adineta vaga]